MFVVRLVLLIVGLLALVALDWCSLLIIGCWYALRVIVIRVVWVCRSLSFVVVRCVLLCVGCCVVMKVLFVVVFGIVCD